MRLPSYFHWTAQPQRIWARPPETATLETGSSHVRARRAVDRAVRENSPGRATGVGWGAPKPRAHVPARTDPDG